MPLLGSGALMNWHNVLPEHRPHYYDWHLLEHMPGRIGVPGFLRGRRYAAVRAPWDFFLLYELAEAAVLRSAPYLTLADIPTALTEKAREHMRPSRRVVARSVLTLGSGQAGYLMTLRQDAAAASLPREAAETILARPLVTGVHEYAAESGTDRVVFIEGLTPDALEQAAEALSPALGGAVERCLFHHQYTVTPADAVTS